MTLDRYGLKLWSGNHSYAEQASELLRTGTAHFIELFILPGTSMDDLQRWASLRAEFIIHAPHYDFGINLSDRNRISSNRAGIGEALNAADLLRADRVIVHPGVDGPVHETARQLSRLHDPRLVVENKPFFGRNDSRCTGSSPEEIGWLTRETGLSFCLDIGHAICSANARGIDPMRYLDAFLALKPVWYHLSDGPADGTRDRHLHFGAGGYDLRCILSKIPRPRNITIETEKDSRDRLDDFEADARFLCRLVASLDTAASGGSHSSPPGPRVTDANGQSAILA